MLRRSRCRAHSFAIVIYLLLLQCLSHAFVIQSPPNAPCYSTHRHLSTTQSSISRRRSSCSSSSSRLRAGLIPFDAIADGAVAVAFDHLSQVSHGLIESHHQNLLSELSLQEPLKLVDEVLSSSPAGTEAPLSLLSSSSSLPSTLMAYGGGTAGGSGAAVADSWLLQPAHEHAQPLWGPPDPYLSAGKSIAPLHPPSVSVEPNSIDASTPPLSSASSSSSLPPPSPELADRARTAAAKGWKILDASKIRSFSQLPGFVPDSAAGGFLPRHEPSIPAETPATFASQVEWSAQFLRVVDKLPLVALLYALVEFLGLRSGVDSFKEEVEDDPARATADTIKVTVIRMGAFAILAVLTLVLFGG